MILRNETENFKNNFFKARVYFMVIKCNSDFQICIIILTYKQVQKLEIFLFTCGMFYLCHKYKMVYDISVISPFLQMCITN